MLQSDVKFWVMPSGAREESLEILPTIIYTHTYTQGETHTLKPTGSVLLSCMVNYVRLCWQHGPAKKAYTSKLISVGSFFVLLTYLSLFPLPIFLWNRSMEITNTHLLKSNVRSPIHLVALHGRTKESCRKTIDEAPTTNKQVCFSKGDELFFTRCLRSSY